MNSLERTISFIEKKSADRVPFHPILMRFAARHAGVRYKDFCLSASHKCMANLKSAADFGSDWVNTMSDPWAEAEAYGNIMTYPDDDLPIVKSYFISEISDIDRIRVLKSTANPRMKERVKEINEYVKKVSDKMFICGWVEGPLAEYCDIRDINMAMTDMYEYPEKVHKALDMITENAAAFITQQIRAGAHCIGIGESVCSLISPELYNEFCFEREKALVDHIHSYGAYSKIHICGNISAILPSVIKTGSDIIDIDHRTGPVSGVVKLLETGQVFSGKSDPVSVIQDGNENMIRESCYSFFSEASGRAILSAGCEVTPETKPENLGFFGSLSSELIIDNSIKTE